MKFKEVLALEKGNCSEIRLYHEGMFWRAYERSAFILCSQVKPLKVTSRRAKSIGGEAICMVGFPEGSFESICGGVEALERTESAMVLRSPSAIGEEEFAHWKEEVSKEGGAVAPPSGNQVGANANDEVARMIKSFTVAEHTPMECMAFIVKLQGLIKI